VSVEQRAGGRRARNSLHLLWAVPLAGAVSFPLLAIAAFNLCGIGCYSPGFVNYDEVPAAILLCGVGGILVFLAVQCVPWTRSPWTRLIASVPAGLLWAGIWFLHGLRAFDPMSPVFGV